MPLGDHFYTAANSFYNCHLSSLMIKAINLTDSLTKSQIDYLAKVPKLKVLLNDKN